MDKILTVYVAEATGLALLGVMKATGPIYGNVAFLTIEPGCSFHTSTSADATEFKKAVEDRTVVAYVEATLLFRMVLHIVGGNLLQEIDIFVGVKLGHFVVGGRFCALSKI